MKFDFETELAKAAELDVDSESFEAGARWTLELYSSEPTRADFRNLVEALELSQQNLKNALQTVEHSLERFKGRYK